MPRVVQAEPSHTSGIMDILSDYFDKKYPDELHVPVEEFVAESSQPIGRVCVQDGEVVGMMGAYVYNIIRRMPRV